MKKTCKIIWWDSSGRVYGKVFSRKSRGELRVVATAEGDSSVPLSSQLRDVNIALRYMQADSIVIYGYLQDFVCFEVKMPHLDNAEIKNLLGFELPRRIPVTKDDLMVSFRADRNNAAPSPIPVRIFAVRIKAMAKIFDALRESGVKFDAFCHPFLAVNLPTGDEMVEFTQIAPGIRLIKGENGLLEMHMTDGGEGQDDAETAVAEYAMSKSFAKDKYGDSAVIL